MRLRLDSEEAMQSFGARLAGALRCGCVIYLSGPLGAGKTTLARGFLGALGHRGPVKSPTYTLIESYPLGRRVVHHLDLYRLADAGELEFIGLRELADAEAICLVEWPERGAGALPPADIDIRIDIADGGGRELRCEAKSARGRDALEGLTPVPGKS
jgi:tRNA threonylcarbamoyladenosine biosynthesis protein TsaE